MRSLLFAQANADGTQVAFQNYQHVSSMCCHRGEPTAHGPSPRCIGIHGTRAARGELAPASIYEPSRNKTFRPCQAEFGLISIAWQPNPPGERVQG